MEQGNPSILSKKASFELNLALKEIFGAVIGIVGYTVLIISAKQNVVEILQSQSRTEPPAVLLQLLEQLQPQAY